MNAWERVHTLRSHGFDRDAIAAILGTTTDEVAALQRGDSGYGEVGVRVALLSDGVGGIQGHGQITALVSPAEVRAGDGEINREITAIIEAEVDDDIFVTAYADDPTVVGATVSILHLTDNAVGVLGGQTTFDADTPGETPVNISGGAPHFTVAGGKLTVVDAGTLIVCVGLNLGVG